MIEFFFEEEFELLHQEEIKDWIADVIVSEERSVGDISFIFCDDKYLHDMNIRFLGHDTLTDIISFGNVLGKEVGGEIYISVERVEDNAKEYRETFEDELHRVIIHGVLHFCGYKDKTNDEKEEMRSREDAALAIRRF